MNENKVDEQVDYMLYFGICYLLWLIQFYVRYNWTKIKTFINTLTDDETTSEMEEIKKIPENIPEDDEQIANLKKCD